MYHVGFNQDGKSVMKGWDIRGLPPDNEYMFFKKIDDEMYNNIDANGLVYNFTTQIIQERAIAELALSKNVIIPDGSDYATISVVSVLPNVTFNVNGELITINTINNKAEIEVYLDMTYKEPIEVSINMLELFAPKVVIKPLLQG